MKIDKQSQKRHITCNESSAIIGCLSFRFDGYVRHTECGAVNGYNREIVFDGDLIN